MSNIAASDLRLTYEDLLTGLSYYNGPGNANCTSNENGPRPTRWYNSGWCPVDLYGNDHLYPTNWIDEQHDEMDLIFCMDAVEFTCNRPSQSSDRDAIRTRYESVMGRTPSEEFIDRAITLCFQGTGSYACTPAATNNNSNKYPAFSRPGVLTTAIIMNSFENPILQNADN